MTEEGYGACLGCGRAVDKPPLCFRCRNAEFCLGCHRGGEARAAEAAAARLNASSAWCEKCRRCSDCSGLAHCMKTWWGWYDAIHGVCEECLGEKICGACCGCEWCCECAPRVAPAVCARCNLRPEARAGAPCAVCREADGDGDDDSDW